MKLYENGEVWQENELVGRHTVDLEGLLPLTDERGTYATFAANQLPKEVTLFADVEKNADFLLKKLKKLNATHTSAFLLPTFGASAKHLFRKYALDADRDWVTFYSLLDAENSVLFIKALVRL